MTLKHARGEPPLDAKRVTRQDVDGKVEEGYIDAAGHFIPVREQRPRVASPANGVDGLMLMASILGDENARATFTPGGIERQEREEQQRMVKSSRLPKSLKTYGWPAELSGMDRFEVLQTKLGIVKRAEYDDLFYTVDLPPGWELRGSDHAMWSYLHDDKGRKRASIFYKGAFYDRKADWSLDRRYYASLVYDTPNHLFEKGARITYGVWDNDGEKVLFKGEFYDRNAKDWPKQDAIEKDAHDWLKEHFPDFANPFAYWE